MEAQYQSVNKAFEKSFREHWDLPALSNYGGMTLSYKDLACRIEELHILFEKCGLAKGDKIAICGKNHANWAASFVATMTYGAVPVPLLHEFKPGSIHHLVNHSDSRILFVDDQVWETLNAEEMPNLDAVIRINDLEVILGCSDAAKEISLSSLLEEKYPGGFKPENVAYLEDKPEDLAIINYTSGTSGFSKGVMLPYLSLWSNIYFSNKVHGQMTAGKNLVAILPSAHMYGLVFEVLYQLTKGVHIHFLTRVPSPKVITQAMSEIKPDLIISVPLVIEKVYKNVIKPELDKPNNRFLCKWVPCYERLMLRKMRKGLIEAFGGRFKEIVIGGAAFNKEIEAFFLKMHFPFTVGYGMTECGPIITYVPWTETKLGAAGKAAPNMEIRIDSSDPVNVPGEVQCRGANVFSGYYNSPEMTKEAFTDDGWFRTGDMGVIDEEGYLFIKGRNKCMILGPSGQNIYPEELETVINNLPYVIDSLVVENDGALTALIYPDFHKAETDGVKDVKACLEEELNQVNVEFPNYAKVKGVEVMPEDFERTPKKSIKRYLYQRKQQ